MPLTGADPLELYDANDDGAIEADEALTAASDLAAGTIDDRLFRGVWELYLQSRPDDGATNASGESDPCRTYDVDDSGVLEEPEAASAIEDYGDGDLSKVEMITVLNCYFAYTADGGFVSNPCWGPEGCWWLTATAVSQTQTAVAQPPDTPTPEPATPTPPAPIVTPAPPTATPTPEPTATPTPEPTDTPTPEPTDTPTPEPTDTPTPEPTAGPTPEPTAAPVPTATPTPAWPGGTLTASPSTIKVGQTFTVTGKLYAYLGQDVDIQFEDAVARPARCNDPSGSSSTRQTITEIPISVEGRGCYAGTGTVKAVVLHGNVIASTTVTVATTVVLPTPTDRTFTKDVTITPFTLLGASGGTPPYEYVVSGLPSGLSFTESTREISGTPTAVGESTVTYSVTDSASQTASVTFKITVKKPPSSLIPAPTRFEEWHATRSDCPSCRYGVIGLQWELPSGVTEYRIEQKGGDQSSWFTLPGHGFALLRKGVQPDGRRFVLVGGLQHGVGYHWRVYAKKGGTESAASSELNRQLSALNPSPLAHQSDDEVKYDITFGTFDTRLPDPSSALRTGTTHAASVWDRAWSGISVCDSSTCTGNTDGVTTEVVSPTSLTGWNCTTSAACHNGWGSPHLTQSEIVFEYPGTNPNGVMVIWTTLDNLHGERYSFDLFGDVEWWDTKRIAIHEMGHPLGLQDFYKYPSADHEGIMNDAHGNTLPSLDDIGYLKQIYYHHPH